MNDYSGFSLIELLITLTVLFIVLAMGVPSAIGWVRAMEVRSSAESLRSALQRARAEAVSRNTRVRITLSNTTGNPGWNVTCVNAAAGCPTSLLSHTIETNNSIRWGAALLAGSSTMTAALKAGAALPATIDFFPLGDAPQVTSGADIARVDVIHSATKDDARLVLRIDGAGNIRLCNPSRPTDHPEACH
jgi:type IV fimbrial biogenesis protein FimT